MSNDVAKLNFGTKAETLKSLSGRLVSGKILELTIFKVKDWNCNKANVIKTIQHNFADQKVIIRSSSLTEDSFTSSCAGEFESVGDIEANDTSALTSAIETVVSGLPSGSDEEQFFCQKFISNVEMAGVIFTKDIDTFAPYYVINYDDQSGSTNSVTSGTVSGLKTFVRFRESPIPPRDPRIALLLRASQEIENLFNCSTCDIEFAITATNELYVFQVRPIIAVGKTKSNSFSDLSLNLYRVFEKIKKLNAPHPGLHGNKAIYSVMTDWNPAEMIGVKPGKLALSLYKELITDSIWSYQRKNYGYRDLRGFPLLISLLGCPYIDVRASFNSFVPADLDERLAGKLIDFYIEKLSSFPADHDKVEFNILYSCYDLSLPSRIRELLGHGFSELDLDRIKFSLLNLTNNIISDTSGLYLSDLNKIKYLENLFEQVKSSNLSVIDKIYWTIENCKRYGTLPFAGLARAGFIAVQFLDSLVREKIFDANDRIKFMGSLNTVAKELTDSLSAYFKGEKTKDSFLKEFGHLRPGTYDILSSRYDQAFDKYFNAQSGYTKHEATQLFRLSEGKLKELDGLLADHGLRVSSSVLLQFISEAIKGREYGKFVFSKSVSYVLSLLEQMGERYKISKQRLAHLDITTVLDLYANLTPSNVDSILNENINRNLNEYETTRIVRMPQLICSENDIYDHFIFESVPNFITQNKVTQIIVTEEELLHRDILNKIVFIRSADPGYDWVFSRGIAGLVSMYGGANSHMAIRCSELNIPAVIGCGEKLFNEWRKATSIEINCSIQKVNLVALRE